MLNWEAEIA